MDKKFLDVKVFSIKKHIPVSDKSGKHLNIKPFDFKRPSKFSKDQIRILEMVHNSFARLSETRLSIATRSVTEIGLVAVDQKTFDEYLGTLKERSFLTVLKSSIFEGDTILQFNNEILFVLLDRMLGGSGVSKQKREFTDIEMNLVEGIMNDFAQALTESWANIENPDFSIQSMETNPQFARSVAPNEMCLVFNFNLSSGEQRGKFSLCLPFVSIKSILDKLNTKSLFADGGQYSTSDSHIKVKESLYGVKLEFSVVLGETKINLAQVKSLEVGDIIKLDRSIDQNMEMVIDEKKIFKVQAGKVSNKIAVQIVDNNILEV